MNQILISTASEEKLDLAKDKILNRSLLYEKDNENLYIKYNNGLIPIGGNLKQDKFEAGDNLEFIKDENNQLILRVVDDVVVKTITATSDGNGINWKAQELIATTSDNHRIVLICKKGSKENEVAVIGGEILEVGDNIKSHYYFSLTSSGTFYLKGITSDSKDASFVTISYKDDIYYGLKFNNRIDTTNIYFTGWKNIPDNLKPIQITDDNTNVEILSEYYPNYFPGTVETDLIYIYSADKKTRSRVSSEGVQAEKLNEETNKWEPLGVFKIDKTGNLIVTNDIEKINSAITSQMPKDSVVYHLDDDKLDQNDQNSKNLIFDNSGVFIQDDYIYLNNSNAYRGIITIPKTLNDFSFFVKSDINTNEAYIGFENGAITSRISLAKKFNSNKSLSWGLTENQLKTVIAQDIGA